MKLEQAIKINTQFLEPLHHLENTETYEALKLSIEALKRLQKIRKHRLSGDFYPLPGETKD